jgi:hypothetical protein
MRKALLAAILIMLSVPTAALAQTPPDDASQTQQLAQRGRGKPDREAMRATTAIAEAAATYKDVVEMAMRGRTAALRSGQTTVNATLPRLRPVLDDTAFAALQRHVSEMEEAQAKEDLTATALAAAEAFKTVVSAIHPAMRRMPPDVALMDYAAMRLTVLASATEIDWPAIQATAKDSEKSWIALRRFIRDGNLRVLLARVQSGLRDAVTRNDAAGVKFAASLQADSVAVLHDLFGRMARAMGRRRGGLPIDTSQL